MFIKGVVSSAHILQGIFSSWNKEKVSSPGATKIFERQGEHSFSLFQEENIPWSICVLLTSPLINICPLSHCEHLEIVKHN